MSGARAYPFGGYPAAEEVSACVPVRRGMLPLLSVVAILVAGRVTSLNGALEGWQSLAAKLATML